MNQKPALLGCLPLVEKIRKRIEQSSVSAIRFRDYMEMCLYDSEYGYYMRDKTKIGRDGDFYTSSNIGSVLGSILARYTIEAAQESGGDRFTITEWGAGTGRLASQILDAVKLDAPDLYERLRYRIVERSGYHRELQERQLAEHLQRIDYALEATDAVDGGAGLVLSNELLDAFPVHRLRQSSYGLMELYVGWNEEQGGFEERELPCTDESLTRYLQQSGITLMQGQTADLNLEAGEWIKQQAAGLGRRTLVTIDYGDRAEELFARHRMAGTLMCYKEHRAYDNPYICVGEQDMTAHVDFSACIRAGEEAGLTSWKLMTQKQFLLENGVLELLQQHAGTDPFSPEAKRNRSVRQLLLSDQMSELFKVLIQKR